MTGYGIFNILWLLMMLVIAATLTDDQIED